MSRTHECPLDPLTDAADFERPSSFGTTPDDLLSLGVSKSFAPRPSHNDLVLAFRARFLSPSLGEPTHAECRAAANEITTLYACARQAAKLLDEAAMGKLDVGVAREAAEMLRGIAK